MEVLYQLLPPELVEHVGQYMVCKGYANCGVRTTNEICFRCTKQMVQIAKGAFMPRWIDWRHHPSENTLPCSVCRLETGCYRVIRTPLRLCRDCYVHKYVMPEYFPKRY
jgi:hypothetical protein